VRMRQKIARGRDLTRMKLDSEKKRALSFPKPVFQQPRRI